MIMNARKALEKEIRDRDPDYQKYLYYKRQNRNSMLGTILLWAWAGVVCLMLFVSMALMVQFLRW